MDRSNAGVSSNAAEVWEKNKAPHIDKCWNIANLYLYLRAFKAMVHKHTRALHRIVALVFF